MQICNGNKEKKMNKQSSQSKRESAVSFPKAPTYRSNPRLIDGSSEDDSESEDEQFRSIKATLTSEEYDAASIKAEFKSYQSILPKPDKLLQQQHSCEMLRDMIESSKIELPRFLKYEYEGGMKPHYALCCLLLKDYSRDAPNETGAAFFCSWLVWALSLGMLHRQRHTPADIIHDQFNRVAHVIPSQLVLPEELRKQIRNSGLPVPNFFLDPEDDKQFPPHIAMLVILQDGEEESEHMGSVITYVGWFLFALVALILRLVLEVIGGAGAIWGGAEVFYIRNDDNKEVCRAVSIGVGILCLFRFVVLNAPQNEDVGDILGPAGPWSLRAPARLRAVCDHPFHYFVRAKRPYSHAKDKRSLGDGSFDEL